MFFHSQICRFTRGSASPCLNVQPFYLSSPSLINSTSLHLSFTNKTPQELGIIQYDYRTFGKTRLCRPFPPKKPDSSSLGSAVHRSLSERSCGPRKLSVVLHLPHQSSLEYSCQRGAFQKTRGSYLATELISTPASNSCQIQALPAIPPTAPVPKGKSTFYQTVCRFQRYGLSRSHREGRRDDGAED